jgi:cell division protein FtsL
MGEVFSMADFNRDSYVRGNTVLVPEYNPSRKYNDEKYKKLEKAKKEAQIKVRKQQTRQKLVVLRMIAFIFIVGVVLLLRYATIYKMEANLQSYKTSISNLKAQNESLRLLLAQSSNIKSVENTAINDLHMKRANASEVITVDLTKENFKLAQVNSTPTSILEKLKHILF